MDKQNSKTSINIRGTDDAEQVFNFLKSVVVGQQDSVTSMQNIRLIWLDKNIDEENSIDDRKTITQLRQAVNNLNIFVDVDQCIDFLTDINNEQVFIIISGALCQKTVPLIHDIVQLHTIFIYCENKTRHEHWAKEWSKVKGVFTEISLISETFEQVAQQCEQNTMSSNFFKTNNEISEENVDQPNGSFMYTQIMKEILLTNEFEQRHIKQSFDYCRGVFTDNHYTLNIIGHHSGEIFTIYRGQGMLNGDFGQIVKTKNGLMSFNNFLSTSIDYMVSLAFAEINKGNPDLVGILFFMTIEHSQSTTPFASITNAGITEGELLFSMHTIFRIRNIIPMDENHRLFQVDLILTSDHDRNLHVPTDHMREETFPDNEGWYQLSLFLLQIRESDKAQQVHKILVEQKINDSEKGPIYSQFKLDQHKLDAYTDVIRFYEKLLDIRQKALLLNYPNRVNHYNNIGAVYENMSGYSRVPSFFEKALKIS